MALEPRPDLTDAFYSLSAALTGFSEIELHQTGAGHRYLGWLARVFPDVLPDLLSAWERIEREYQPDQREDGLWQVVLADPKLGPFTRGILGLWYTATWTPMPDSWSSAYGDHDDANSVFALAYPEALVWRVNRAVHPEGAKPTGFGSWAMSPQGA